jgi:hypothetical protein
MRSTQFMLFAMTCSTLALPAACGSQNGDEADSSAGGRYATGAGGNSSLGGGANSISQLPKAQDTANGLYAVTADVAASLETSTSVCSGGQSTPQGGGAVLEFVIDVSGSMSDDHVDPNDDNSQTKWQVFSATLPSIFQAMSSSFAVGALYFSANKNQCYQANRADVPIAMMTQTQEQTLVNSVSTVSVGGSTPTYLAWDHAVDVVQAWQPGANDPASMATAKRFVVLITDGVPTIAQPKAGATTCSQNSSGISLADYTTELGLMSDKTDKTGVDTFVVGVVGSNNPQGATFDPLYMLSKIAVLGHTEQPPGCAPVSGTPLATDVQPRGTYCHYDLSTSTDLGASLTTTLSQIASSVLSCTYSVPPPAGNGQTIDPSQTVLIYTDGATGQPSIVLQNTSATCDKGWHYTDATNSKIEICGTTCAAIQGSTASKMSAVFGCNVSQIIL